MWSLLLLLSYEMFEKSSGGPDAVADGDDDVDDEEEEKPLLPREFRPLCMLP